MEAVTSGSKVRLRKEDSELAIDPVYHALSRINGEINRMTKPQLQHRLVENGLNDRGVKEVLRKRLKNHYKKQKLKIHRDHFKGSQCYPFIVVIDFEATCEESNPQEYLHEIIEFPAILIDTETKQIADQFRSFCRPTLNPKLSTFCNRLTGINQQTVDNAPLFATVLKDFEAWLKLHCLLGPYMCAFVTDGSWDFSRFLNIQCCLSEIPYPKWAKKWVNLKKVFGNFYGLKRPKIMDMLANVGLEFEGRQHCGLDDAFNISKVVLHMLEDGADFQVNERLRAGKLETITEKERILLANRENDPNAADQGTVEAFEALSITPATAANSSEVPTTFSPI